MPQTAVSNQTGVEAGNQTSKMEDFSQEDFNTLKDNLNVYVIPYKIMILPERLASEVPLGLSEISS